MAVVQDEGGPITELTWGFVLSAIKGAMFQLSGLIYSLSGICNVCTLSLSIEYYYYYAPAIEMAGEEIVNVQEVKNGVAEDR